MTIGINEDKTYSGEQRSDDFFSSQTAEALHRFESHITKIEVHLIDENERKDGFNEVSCLLEAKIEGRETIAITNQANTMDIAVTGAIDKIKNYYRKYSWKNSKNLKRNSMKINKNLGIWMDHSTANLIDLDSNKKKPSIVSKFTSETKEDALHRSESLMHNKRQQMHEKFYKKIGSEILKYKHVLLFGPTNAKLELHNYLNKDLHFKNINIDVASTENITDNEQVAFVKNHFDKL